MAFIENTTVSNLTYNHFDYAKHSDQPDFRIEVLDSVVYRRVFITVVLLCNTVKQNDLTVTMRSILSMVDCMLFSSIGAIPSLNPYGCQGFEINADRERNTITIEIGYEGFDREKLQEQFFLTAHNMNNQIHSH